MASCTLPGCSRKARLPGSLNDRARLPSHVIDAMDLSGSADAQPTASPPEGADSVSPGIRQGSIDYGALWRQVEAESARVVVIDLERCAILTGRIMSGARERYAFLMPDSPLDRLFPRADALVKRWSQKLMNEPAALVVHNLSPRHWTYFWRLGPKVAMLAAVRHRYGRGAVAAGDAAAIQLLCEHWLAPELQSMAEGRAEQKRSYRVDTRTRATARRELRGALAVLVLATACGLWLAAGGASAPPPDPAAPTLAEQERLARLSDDTLVRSLVRALADRNPMLAQLTLDDHLFLGHYAAAVVLDEGRQVVARAGLATPVEVGQPLPPAASAALGAEVRQFALRQADRPIGQVLMVPRAAAAPAGARPVAGGEAWPDTAKRVAGVLLALAGLLAGVRLWRHLVKRYR